jgi:hypothetical protein
MTTTLRQQLAAKDAEIADLKRQLRMNSGAADAQINLLKRELEIKAEELRISRQAEKYSYDVADQADATRREAERQLDEARKDTERLDWLAQKRLFLDSQLGWIPSLYPYGWKLFGDTLREATDAAREGEK